MNNDFQRAEKWKCCDCKKVTKWAVPAFKPMFCQYCYSTRKFEVYEPVEEVDQIKLF